MRKEDFVTPKEVPDLLPVSLHTVRAWIFQGKLPVVRMGRKVLVQRAVLERIQEEGLEAVQD
jgi:excisionase family DNA binding protein